MNIFKIAIRLPLSICFPLLMTSLASASPKFNCTLKPLDGNKLEVFLAKNKDALTQLGRKQRNGSFAVSDMELLEIKKQFVETLNDSESQDPLQFYSDPKSGSAIVHGTLSFHRKDQQSMINIYTNQWITCNALPDSLLNLESKNGKRLFLLLKKEDNHFVGYMVNQSREILPLTGDLTRGLNQTFFILSTEEPINIDKAKKQVSYGGELYK